MSILAGKLALFTLVPVISAGVAYPMVTRLGGGKNQISLPQMEDFERNCWVSVQGEPREESGGFKKKLLACSFAGNSSEVKFYFYDETKGTGILPKAVTEARKENTGFRITLLEQEENINTINQTWDKVFDGTIKRGCEITKRNDEVEGEIRKLSCNDQHAQRLEKFESKK